MTSVVIGITSVRPEQPPRFSFVADRPCFYAICDYETGRVVFMGTVVAPDE